MLLQESLALRLRLHKLEDCGILAPITLYDAMKKLGRSPELVEGYIKMNYDVTWHVWVECEGKIIDMGMILASHVDKRFLNFKPEYLREVPDDGQVEMNEKIVEDMKLFKEDPKKFWGSVSKKFKEFRSKFLSKYLLKD